ncbi:hypothetical protein [Nonomuraea jabiensis]|uniref:hypothetical protein n=1 Tax=Nonomuraea jabiensis TaxID=882448 RepID=UPI0036A6DCBD
MLSSFSSATAPPARRHGDPVGHLDPALGDALLDGGLHVGQRPFGVVGGHVPAPDLLQEGDRGLRPHLLAARSAASASVSPSAYVAAGMILSWCGCRP